MALKKRVYPDLPRPHPSPPRTPAGDPAPSQQLTNFNSQSLSEIKQAAKNHEHYEKRKSQAQRAAARNAETIQLIEEARLIEAKYKAARALHEVESKPVEPQPLDEKILAKREAARIRMQQSRARMKIIKQIVDENPQLTDVINNDMPRCSVCNSNSRVIMLPDTDFADFYCTRCEFYW